MNSIATRHVLSSVDWPLLVRSVRRRGGDLLEHEFMATSRLPVKPIRDLFSGLAWHQLEP